MILKYLFRGIIIKLIDNFTIFDYVNLFNQYFTFDADFNRVKSYTLGEYDSLMFSGINISNTAKLRVELIRKKALEIESRYKIESEKIYKSKLENLNPLDLKITEEETKVKSLIISRLVSNYNAKTFLIINDLNVKKIKLLIPYFTISGKNLINNMCYRITRLEKLIKALDFYEDQVIRQSIEEHDIGTNLFKLNYDKKREIIQDELKSYIDYLEKNAHECVWGTCTKASINIMKSALNKKYSIDMLNLNNMIDCFSNYLTLEELEKGVVKNKTLDRFIIN